MKLNHIREQGIYHITSENLDCELRHDIHTIIISRGFAKLGGQVVATWVADTPSGDWMYSEVIEYGNIQWGDELEVEKKL